MIHQARTVLESGDTPPAEAEACYILEGLGETVAQRESTGYGADMRFIRLCLPLLLIGLTGGCVVPIAEPVYSTCRGVSGGDWRASIERVPRWRGGKPIKPILVVSGKIQTAEAIDVSMTLGPVEKLDRRVRQVLVRTEGRAAENAPTVMRHVRARFEAGEVQSLRIRCGDGIFASIAIVPEAPSNFLD